MPGPPPPPPVAPPAAAPPPASKSRNALLDSIEKGKKLKKTVVNDRSAPMVASEKKEISSTSSVGGAGSGSTPSSGLAAPGGLFAGGMPKLRPTGSSFKGAPVTNNNSATSLGNKSAASAPAFPILRKTSTTETASASAPSVPVLRTPAKPPQTTSQDTLQRQQPELPKIEPKPSIAPSRPAPVPPSSRAGISNVAPPPQRTAPPPPVRQTAPISQQQQQQQAPIPPPTRRVPPPPPPRRDLEGSPSPAPPKAPPRIPSRESIQQSSNRVTSQENLAAGIQQLNVNSGNTGSLSPSFLVVSHQAPNKSPSFFASLKRTYKSGANQGYRVITVTH